MNNPKRSVLAVALLAVGLALVASAGVAAALDPIQDCPPGYSGQIILGSGTCCEIGDTNQNGVPEECYSY